MLVCQVTGRDRAARREACPDGLDPFERDVRDDEVGGGQLGGSCIEQARVELDAVRTGVLPGDLDRDLVHVDSKHRREAEPGRGDREHAGAAADVEEGATRLVEQELEAEPRRGVRAGAEGAAGVDDDRERACRRLFPRRADPECADRDPVVELAPAVLPAVGDLADERVGEGGEDAGGGLAVGGQLEGAGALGLFESLGSELDEAGAELFGLGDGRRDGCSDQRNALLSLSKNPWSAL